MNILGIVPPFAPRDWCCIHDLRQQRSEQRAWAHIPLSVGQGHFDRRFLSICRPQHAVFHGHLLRGTRD
jgi:hypothetical protein